MKEFVLQISLYEFHQRGGSSVCWHLCIYFKQTKPKYFVGIRPSQETETVNVELQGCLSILQACSAGKASGWDTAFRDVFLNVQHPFSQSWEEEISVNNRVIDNGCYYTLERNLSFN